MTKNMTRKGLALGSAAALVVAGFVGATPAYAAFATLDAGLGTSGATQNGLLGQTFNLASTTDNFTQTKFYVTGASAAELTAIARDVTSLTTPTTGTSPAPVAYDEAVTITDQTDGLDKAATLHFSTWAASEFAQIRVGLTGVTTTRTITITPFIDNVVANGLPTAGEVSGTPVTLTFHKASEVTATTTIDAVTAGATSLTSYVTLDKDVNLAAIEGGVKVLFSENGTAIGSSVDAAYDSVSKKLKAAKTSITTSAIAVYSAQARVGGDAAANNSGSAVLSEVTTGKISNLSALTVAKGNSYLATFGTSPATADAIRAGSGTLVLSTNATTDSKAVAGATVTFSIEEVTAGDLDAAGSITAGGKTVSGAPATAQKTTVDVTTDADGKATLSLSYAALKNGNKFNVTISAISATGVATVAAPATKTFNAVNSVATAIVDVNKLGGSAGDSPVHATTKGGNVSVSYQLVDQFGQTPEGTHRVKVATKAGASAINSTIAVVSGVATLSFTDNSEANGAYASTASVERYDADTETWGSAIAGVEEVSTIQAVSALPAATRVTVTETPDSTATSATNVLSSAALATVDARLSLNSVTLPAIDAANSTLNGFVYGANGAPQAGATVTLSAPGLMFVTNAAPAEEDGHYSLGSTTIKTDANGAWGDVDVLSTVAGKHTVTVTSGSATTTTDVFFGAAAANAGDKVTITAPVSVRSGSTLQVSAIVTDKFGNPVDTTAGTGAADAKIAISYTGPGLIVGTLPGETDKDGKLNFNVLMGSNDTGTFAVTITYQPTGSATATTNKSAQASIVVGTAPVVGNDGDYSSWTKKLNDSSAKMYAKNVIGEGKVQFFLNGSEIAWVRAVDASDPKLRSANGAAYLVRTVDFVEGQKNVLEIYVDGVRTTRTAYTY